MNAFIQSHRQTTLKNVIALHNKITNKNNGEREKIAQINQKCHNKVCLFWTQTKKNCVGKNYLNKQHPETHSHWPLEVENVTPNYIDGLSCTVPFHSYSISIVCVLRQSVNEKRNWKKNAKQKLDFYRCCYFPAFSLWFSTIVPNKHTHKMWRNTMTLRHVLCTNHRNAQILCFLFNKNNKQNEINSESKQC